MAYLLKKNSERTDKRTDRQTNERTDGRTVRLYYTPNFKIWGHKNQFKGTATQPQRNRKVCQFNKDQYRIYSQELQQFQSHVKSKNKHLHFSPQFDISAHTAWCDTHPS